MPREGPHREHWTHTTNFRIIINIVAEHFHIDTEDILSRKRSARIARARMLAMYLMKRAGGSEPEIGEFLRRDHSTIHYAYYKIKEEREQFPEFSKMVGKLEENAASAVKNDPVQISRITFEVARVLRRNDSDKYIVENGTLGILCNDVREAAGEIQQLLMKTFGEDVPAGGGNESR